MFHAIQDKKNRLQVGPVISVDQDDGRAIELPLRHLTRQQAALGPGLLVVESVLNMWRVYSNRYLAIWQEF